MTIDHKTKVHGIPSQKKIVQKNLSEYLKNNLNKQKIDEILEKRRRKSMMMSRNSMRARTSSAQTTSTQKL